MNFTQRALRFSCQGSALIGVVDVPERPLARGVLVLTGARQYRVGGHRQFALLARVLAPRGLPVMRFDCRGIGDSEGGPRRYDALGDDVRAAMKEFAAQVPEMQEVVVWGLDDAATAAALYAHTDPRVRGLVLLNPWMRHPEAGERAALLPHLRARFGELGFWRRIAAGSLDGRAALGAPHARHSQRSIAMDVHLPLKQRVIASLACFEGKTLVVLGGADPQAKAFADLLDRHHASAERTTIAGANHSFASRAWRDEVAEVCADWIVSW
jgi:exosortase A-associated hydrolase 1